MFNAFYFQARKNSQQEPNAGVTHENDGPNCSNRNICRVGKSCEAITRSGNLHWFSHKRRSLFHCVENREITNRGCDMAASYLMGLVTPDKYHEAKASDAEIWRAEQLASGEANPVTGFEIHFLNALRHEVTPHTPKERALFEKIGYLTETHYPEDEEAPVFSDEYHESEQHLPYPRPENGYLGSFWAPPKEAYPVTGYGSITQSDDDPIDDI